MCNAGYADCDDEPSNGCEVNSSIALNNCGSCGNVCAMPHTIPMCVNGTCVIGACDNGFADCDGNPSNGCEVNLLVDLNHCGACGAHCPTGCISGICPLPCSPPFAESDGDASNGCETNLMTDPANCGACGVDCSELDAGTCHNGTCD
jgi:hypothetical protein